MKLDENLGWRRLIYWAIIFIILTIFFWTMAMNESDAAVRLFSFAATITSIVLAVVSIVFSIVSGFKTFSSIGSMQDASEKIGNVSHDLMNIKDALNTDITKLNSLEKNVTDILCSNEALRDCVSNLLNSSQQTERGVREIHEMLNTPKELDPSEKKSPNKRNILDNFDRKNYTVAARIMLYACSLTQREGYPREFPISILLNERWEQYFYGYAYCLNGLLDSNIFEVEVREEKTMVVKKFDTTYFATITRELLLQDVSKKEFMEARLEAIDTYFAKNKEAL